VRKRQRGEGSDAILDCKSVCRFLTPIISNERCRFPFCVPEDSMANLTMDHAFAFILSQCSGLAAPVTPFTAIIVTMASLNCHLSAAYAPSWPSRRRQFHPSPRPECPNSRSPGCPSCRVRNFLYRISPTTACPSSSISNRCPTHYFSNAMGRCRFETRV